MSDQTNQNDPNDRAARRPEAAERFETVWDRAANGGVGGWVRRRVAAPPTVANPAAHRPNPPSTDTPDSDAPDAGTPGSAAPPRPHHQPTAHLPAVGPVPGPPTPMAGPGVDQQATVDNPAARAALPGPPPAWPAPGPIPPPTPHPRPDVTAAHPADGAPAADWFQQERGPSPFPAGGTFADAAHTPVHGLPPARDVPPAPDWYRGGSPPPAGPRSPTPPGPSFERTLLFVVLAVVVVAALGTLVALRPWESDTSSSAQPTHSPTVNRDSPGPRGSVRPSDDPGGQSGLRPDSPPAQTVPATTAPPSTAPPDGRAQAGALDTLLSRSGSSRQSVIDAVNDVGTCSSLSASRTALSDAATQRDNLVSQLDTMRFDGVPELQAAAPTLRVAWDASARADRAFAAWAQSALDSGCPGTKSLYDDGATISAEASAAKKSFVDTWNTVAARYGLTSRSEIDL